MARSPEKNFVAFAVKVMVCGAVQTTEQHHLWVFQVIGVPRSVDLRGTSEAHAVV